MTTDKRIYIVGMGIISPFGYGTEQTKNAIASAQKSIKPLTLFPAGKILPVGEISELQVAGRRSQSIRYQVQTPNTKHQTLNTKHQTPPRTHHLALMAAKEAMADIKEPPEAIVMGGTTGGILTTEEYLKAGNHDPTLFQYHSISSVAEYIAKEYHCKGPVLSVSTACSSGTAAIKIAVEMLRTGKVRNVLVGGADSLCRLTYYGFNSLQLIDIENARPFDKNRKGMNVAEGAAMLFLVAASEPPEHAIAEILGGGLSCDAYHATAPHPEGKGAFSAMMSAIKDAGISPDDIDYINLHGTGTIDNDRSEAKGLRAIWKNNLPHISSIKGALGHSIAAAGANEAVISALCIANQFIPANTGYHELDPELNVLPVQEPLSGVKVNIVLSNSFGFGGNNASIILGKPEIAQSATRNQRFRYSRASSPFSILNSACITGAGDTEKTLNALLSGKSCKGSVGIEEISKHLPSRLIRRLKRLPRLSLALASSAALSNDSPASIFFGTGWGALSETYDFLTKLYESEEQFTSPTDFIGSVHNAPAGQMAIFFQSTGTNITATTGDYSFEHALFIADILTKESDDTILVVGADEFHPILSPLFDPSVLSDETFSDGGGAICLKKKGLDSHVKILPLFFEYAYENPSVISSLIQTLGGSQRINDEVGAIFVGIPGAFREKGREQLNQFLSFLGFGDAREPCIPVIDYRKFLGEFASASAAVTVIAAQFIMRGKIPAQLCSCLSLECGDVDLDGKSILMMNLGDFVTASILGMNIF